MNDRAEREEPEVRGGPPLGPGSSVDRYTVEALIGRGGMGEVYRAVDTRLRRKVALKVLRPDDSKNPDGVARLFREARAAAALSHPNTVAIHDLGETDGLVYIVMELVSGQPLMAYVGDDRVSLARRLKWLTEIARALATAHRAGVIHRDVKPSNVMVSEDDVAKVLDFGLAKPMPRPSGEPESFGFKTQAGRVLGTVRYMAPEQMIGSDADGRSDQYSLGMTAFELIAGRYPPGKAFEIPPLLSTLVPAFPADGALVVARMLKRIPEDRFASMEEVVSAFEDIAASRPVRVLDAPHGAKPARHPVVLDRSAGPLDDGAPPNKTGLDPPDKHLPETMPERIVGSTLTSAEDELSADTVLAIEEALQPTISPAELALAATVLPGIPTPIAATPAPVETTADSKAAVSRPAASSTLQSADAGDRVRALREATSKVPKEPTGEPNEPKESTEPRDEPKEAAAAAELRKTPAAGAVHTTLASKKADEAVIAVRNATAPRPAPRVESVPPPKKKVEAKEAPAQKPEPEPALPPVRGKTKSNVVWFVLAVLFLALAAFAGNYFGAKSRKSE